MAIAHAKTYLYSQSSPTISRRQPQTPSISTATTHAVTNHTPTVTYSHTQPQPPTTQPLTDTDTTHRHRHPQTQTPTGTTHRQSRWRTRAGAFCPISKRPAM